MKVIVISSIVVLLISIVAPAKGVIPEDAQVFPETIGIKQQLEDIQAKNVATQQEWILVAELEFSQRSRETKIWEELLELSPEEARASFENDERRRIRRKEITERNKKELAERQKARKKSENPGLLEKAMRFFQ